MLKRIISSALAVLIFTVFLCGCAGHRELDKGYMLTAIGFENDDGGFKVVAELLSVSDMQDSSPEPQVLASTGETPQSALYNLSLDFPRAVYFDHCATLAIGQGIEREKLSLITDYCLEAENLNLNMDVIYSPDVEQLFNTPTVSAAVGYHIMRLLSFKTKESGVDFKSKFYEFAKSEKSGDGTFSLPAFSGGEEISLEGSLVFKGQKAVMALNDTESIAYALISGRFKKGRVSIGREYADIKRVNYKFSAIPDGQTLTAELTAGLNTDEASDGFFNTLQKAVDELITKAAGEDIFLVEKRAAERGITVAQDTSNTQIKYRVEKR